MIQDLLPRFDQLDEFQQCLFCSCPDCMDELRSPGVWILDRTPVDLAIQILSKISGPFDYYVLEDRILIIDK